jgi:serine/threonine protein kinase/tetratricopeptide (TPR) repeat protein
MTQTISHYELLEQLGEGGMGVVYKARDTQLHRFVALKFLPAGVQSRPERLEQLVSEARTAAALNHPNICTIYELGNIASEESAPFIAMEYLEGRTLRECLAGGQLPLPDVLAYAEQITEGLRTAHAHGIIHRDIKPENVFVTSQGTAKILDFGLACATEREPLERGKISGSGMYMSPEQYRGDKLDVGTDIWSFGVVLYEMLAGEAPFRGRYAQSLLYSILNEEPAPIAELRPEVPGPLADLCHRCLSKQSENRPANTDRLIGELRTFRSGDARPAALQTPKRFVLRLSIVTAVIVLGIAGWLLFKPFAGKPQRQQGPICIAILPIENVAHNDSIAKWSPLYQFILEQNLGGSENFAVKDPSSFNSLLSASIGAGMDFFDRIAEMDIDYIVRGTIVPSGHAHRLDIKLVDVHSQTVRFGRSRVFRDTDGLGSVLDSLSLDIAGYFSVAGTPTAQKQDVDQWMSARNQNMQAIEAFIAAYRMIYEGQQNARVPLREALRLDSTFIAPRIWLAAGLWQAAKRGEAGAGALRQEALSHEATLRRFYTRATPFEQAMIDFVSAYFKDSLSRQRDYLQTALVYSPDNNIVRLNLSWVSYQLGDFEGAERILAPAVDRNWRYYTAHTWLAHCQSRQEKYARAYTTMKKALELNPTDLNGMLDCFVLCLRAGEQADSAMWEDRSIRLLKEQGFSGAGIQAKLGDACLRYGLSDQAIRRYRAAANEEPGNIDALLGLAETARQSGDLPAALEYFRGALRIDPGLSQPYKEMGDIYLQRSQRDSARRAYQLFLKYDSSSPVATAVRRQLHALSK